MPRRPNPPALIGGPYLAPSLRVGDRTVCLFRDREVKVTAWTDAPIPWPRCQPVGGRGGLGLLVNPEMLRAIRTESALALEQGWGVSRGTVTRWRRAFGIKRLDTPCSAVLHSVISQRGGAYRREHGFTPQEIARRVATWKARGYAMPDRWGEDGWKPEESALLGTLKDKGLAERIGRSRAPVRTMRARLGIPPFQGSD